MSRERRIRNHYEPLLDRHGDSYRALDWASAASQVARFGIFVDNVEVSGKTLLDVGCGLGDFYGFCKQRQIDVDYTGVDILERMVQAARRRFPEGRFIRADVFTEDLFEPESFDVVFCSGTFNLDLGNREEFLPGALERLYELTRSVLAFNLLDSRSGVLDPKYAHYDPRRVLELVRSFGCDARLIEDYLPNDFTVICTKPAR